MGGPIPGLGGPIIGWGGIPGGGPIPGGIPGIPGGGPGIPGLIFIGGGILTPPGPGTPPGNFPALNAAVVASIKLWACSSIHF